MLSNAFEETHAWLSRLLWLLTIKSEKKVEKNVFLYSD